MGMISGREDFSAKEQEEWVLQEYDFYPESIEDGGKIKKICCNRGQFVLKKTGLPVKHLSWLASCFQHLQAKKFTSFLPFFPNKYGDPFVALQGSCYYTLPWIEDEVGKKYSENWAEEVIERLAELHYHTLDLATSSCPISPLSLMDIARRWQKRLKKMEAYKRWIEREKWITPVEIIFLERYEYLQQLAERALQYLQKWKQQALFRDLRYVLCHGYIHRKHVLYQQEKGLYFIDFEHANMDTPARDLALFFRRNVDLSGQLAAEGALHYFEAYERNFPLTKAEKILFAIFMLFPEHIFKEIDLYFQQGRSTASVQQVVFFEKQVQATLAIRKFIKQLLY